MAALGLISVSGFRLCGTNACVASACSRRTQLIVPGGSSLSRRPKATKINTKQILPSQNTLCQSTAVDTAEAEAEVMELELKVEGMTCNECSSRVTEALKAMNGVDKVDVDLATGIATIEVHANDPIEAFNSMPRLVDKIRQLGFKAQAHFEDWM